MPAVVPGGHGRHWVWSSVAYMPIGQAVHELLPVVMMIIMMMMTMMMTVMMMMMN